jgi:hypothetical protein
MTRTCGTPLDTPSHATLLSPLRVIPRAEKGRMGREKGVSHRSTTVTQGQQRTLENRPRPGAQRCDQARRSKAVGGSIPPSSTTPYMVIYQGFCRGWETDKSTPSAKSAP